MATARHADLHKLAKRRSARGIKHSSWTSFILANCSWAEHTLCLGGQPCKQIARK